MQNQLTPKQEAVLNNLEYNDLYTAAMKAGVLPETLEEWEQQPAFRDTLKLMKDCTADYIFQEIIMEGNRLLTIYRNLQEHMTLPQRVSFLESLSKAVSNALKPEQGNPNNILKEVQPLHLPEQSEDTEGLSGLSAED